MIIYLISNRTIMVSPFPFMTKEDIPIVYDALNKHVEDETEYDIGLKNCRLICSINDSGWYIQYNGSNFEKNYYIYSTVSKKVLEMDIYADIYQYIGLFTCVKVKMVI